MLRLIQCGFIGLLWPGSEQILFRIFLVGRSSKGEDVEFGLKKTILGFFYRIRNQIRNKYQFFGSYLMDFKFNVYGNKI